jgi:hypothetical protein
MQELEPATKMRAGRTVRACRESGEDRESGSLYFSLSESREPGRRGHREQEDREL